MDAFIQVGLVRGLVAFDISEAPRLLVTPLRRHPVEEPGVDPAVELVHVHRVHPALEPGVFVLKPPDGGVMLTFLIGVAAAQRLAHPGQHFIVEGQPVEHGGELAFENLFAGIGLRAFPPVSGAMVVDVLLLLDLPHHRASAVTAGNQARERELVLAAPRLPRVPPVEHVLDLLPQFA